MVAVSMGNISDALMVVKAARQTVVLILIDARQLEDFYCALCFPAFVAKKTAMANWQKQRKERQARFNTASGLASPQNGMPSKNTIALSRTPVASRFQNWKIRLQQK